jgi:hypothetical protein
MSIQPFPQVLKTWYEANQENLFEALADLKESYLPRRDNLSFQVFYTLQNLAEEGEGQGILLFCRDESIGLLTDVRKGEEYFQVDLIRIPKRNPAKNIRTCWAVKDILHWRLEIVDCSPL